MDVPFTQLARCEARNAATAANSSGVPMRPAGISRAQPAKTPSGLTFVRVEILFARLSRRAVRVYPGQALFTVMPSDAYSFAGVRVSPVSAERTEARIELESSNPSAGCFTAPQGLLMNLPQLFSFLPAHPPPPTKT